jgi:hypothetical protein
MIRISTLTNWMRRLGMPNSASGLNQAWISGALPCTACGNDVHTAALEDYGISGADLFYPGLAP